MEEESVEVLTPAPGRSALAERGCAGPVTDTEKNVAEVLADVVCVERVSVDSHFFDDLSANSLTMDHLCARVRKRADLPSVSMRDIYRNPTIRSLAVAFEEVAPAPAEPSVPARTQAVEPAGKLRYVLCGTSQLLLFLDYSFLAAVITVRGYAWVSDSSGPADVYLRSLLFGGAGFVGLCAFPVVARWILVGRWKAGGFPVWELTYLRFWTVKVMLHANPMTLFVGNPLYVLYLRALGARIGEHVTILSRAVPVCTDLLTIGAGTVIRKDSYFLCYRAQAGRIETGPVTLGRDAFVGENTVLDIDTSMGDGAQLGHTSALQRGQGGPDGEHWHGSPAQRTEVDYVRVAPARCDTLRRAGYGLLTVVQLFLLYVPLTVGGLYMLLTEVPALDDALAPGTVGLRPRSSVSTRWSCHSWCSSAPSPWAWPCCSPFRAC